MFILISGGRHGFGFLICSFSSRHRTVLVTGILSTFFARVTAKAALIALRVVNAVLDLSHDFEPGDMFSTICIRQ
jgi:hypothetical protein